MANYFVTNTARFNPFTYQEMRAPIAEATAQHYAMAEALASIDDGTLASYLAGANPENSIYRKKYEELLARGKQISADIDDRNISLSQLKRDALRLRRDFASLKTPVEAGAKRMQTILSEYDKAARSGMMIGENPHDKDIDYFIEHPEYSPQYKDAKQLIALGASAGEAMAIDYEPTYQLSPDGKYYNIQTRKTATADEIRSNSTYRKSVDDLLKLEGFNPENTDSFTQQARSMIEFGMANSMSDRGLKQQVNPGYTAPEKTTIVSFGDDFESRMVVKGNQTYAQDPIKDENGNIIGWSPIRVLNDDERDAAGKASSMKNIYPTSQGPVKVSNGMAWNIDSYGNPTTPASEEQLDELRKAKVKGINPKEDPKDKVVGVVTADGSKYTAIDKVSRPEKLTKISLEEAQSRHTSKDMNIVDGYIYAKDNSGKLWKFTKEGLIEYIKKNPTKVKYEGFSNEDLGIQNLGK